MKLNDKEGIKMNEALQNFTQNFAIDLSRFIEVAGYFQQKISVC